MSQPSNPRQVPHVPLGIQWLLCLVGIALLVTAAAGFVVRSNELSLLKDIQREEQRKKFRLLVHSARGDLLDRKSHRLPGHIQALANSDSMLWSVRITDPAGAAITDWRRPGQSRPEQPISLSYKVLFEGKPIARISATWDASFSLGLATHYLYRSLLAVGIACLLFALVTFVIFDATTLRPLRSIAEKFHQCRRGNFSTVAEIPGYAAAELKDLEQSSLALSEIFSARDRTQAELVATRELARSATAAREDFLANMSHELRTPLNAINGFAEMLAGQVMGPIGNPEYIEYAKNIKESGVQLLGMINNILDLSRLRAGKESLQIEPVNIAQALQSSIDIVEGFADMNGLKIERDIDMDLPVLDADPLRLNQIMQNLLSNAIKFTRPGGVIRVSAMLQPTVGVVVSVIDEGIGIAPDRLDEIMEPFTQIESSMTREHHGTGLGLALAKTFVELHGGALHIASEPAVGTNVTFTLPAPRSGPGDPDTQTAPLYVGSRAINAV